MRIITILFCSLALVACGEKTQPVADGGSPGANGAEAVHDHEAPGPHGGATAVVGDHVAHLEAIHDDVLGQVTVYVMDTNDDLLKLDQEPVLNLVTDAGSAQVQPTAVGGAWVFEHEALVKHPEKARFRLVLGGKTYRIDMPCAHDHAHEGEDHGPHDGVPAGFADGLGHLELKLHDDKGDLELWLTKDEAGQSPYDLPLDARITVTFGDHGGREVALAVRDGERNEDEDGQPNLRDGKTNYFIFPGDTGADASWLMGSDFVSQVFVTIEADGKTFITQPFELRPHTHGAGDH
jgi:hypothetical protein